MTLKANKTPLSPRDAVIQALEKYRPFPQLNPEQIMSYMYIDAGHIDSFQILELVVGLEEQFEIRFSSTELQSIGFRSVGGLVTIIEELIAKKGP